MSLLRSSIAISNILRYGAAYNLASAVMQPLAGKLYANLHTKWTFMGFLFVFEIGSLLCGVATSSAMLIVGRAVAGLGGGGIYIGALTIVALIAPMHKRAFLTGLLTGLAQLGLVCGPLVGGVSDGICTSVIHSY
jgi:MFS family permease